MGRWGCSTVIKIARGRRIEIDGIIFVAQRRLEDQHFVFDAAATGEPKVLSDTALAALWLRGSPRILPDSTLPSSGAPAWHDRCSASARARRSRSSIEIYDRRRSTCVFHLERGMARSRNADSIGSFGFTGQSITAACSVMVVGPALSALA